jgi:hypothetical protein
VVAFVTGARGAVVAVVTGARGAVVAVVTGARGAVVAFVTGTRGAVVAVVTGARGAVVFLAAGAGAVLCLSAGAAVVFVGAAVEVFVVRLFFLSTLRAACFWLCAPCERRELGRAGGDGARRAPAGSLVLCCSANSKASLTNKG